MSSYREEEVVDGSWCSVRKREERACDTCSTVSAIAGGGRMIDAASFHDCSKVAGPESGGELVRPETSSQ